MFESSIFFLLFKGENIEEVVLTVCIVYDYVEGTFKRDLGSEDGSKTNNPWVHC